MQKLHYTFLICLGLIVFSLLGCSAANTNEIKSTSPTFHQRWIAPNPNATPVPAYVTAWPKQVSVEKPDPVLGDKLVWEHWIYGEEFAKRFEGFPLEKADQELQNSPIKAITLRIYKDNLWKSSFSNHVQQYSCNVNVFFDASLLLPSSNKNTEKHHIAWMDYPKGISNGYSNLKPIDTNDKEIFMNSQAFNKQLNANPVIFSAKPLDNRFVALGVREYIPHLIRDISVLNLQANIECGIIGPKADQGIFWLSLLGKSPYFQEIDEKSRLAVKGSYKKTDITFEPGAHPEEKGYVKLPRSFYEVALPKMTLIKALNVCIADKQYLNKASKEAQEDLLKHCNEMEKTGVIYDLYNNRYGLTNGGF